MFKSIGIFGGTFDPIHLGHLRSALEIYQELELDEVRFIPCRQPVLKGDTFADVQARLQMLKLAIEDQEGFEIDEREINRTTPSYMVPTLKSLRVDFPQAAFYLLLGFDAFSSLPEWYHWQEILELAHIIVISRTSGVRKLSSVMKKIVAKHLKEDVEQLRKTQAGYIYFKDITLLEISATAIRQLLASGKSPRYLLPEKVYEYILAQGLYKAGKVNSEETLM